jgi:hypothetical protein|tara:strand:+ start:856 stop:993 length:138 start_codon:yes stop_codon:yes gene_type:complete
MKITQSRLKQIIKEEIEKVRTELATLEESNEDVQDGEESTVEPTE